MSIHISNDAVFAKTVLMPGDPLRAKYIAENFLKEYKLVTSIRGILGYTGFTEDGKKISVMASGMGNPSIGIYSRELFSQYGVENIIRIGTAGSYNENVHVGDVILGMASCSDSNYASIFDMGPVHFSPVGNYELINQAYCNALKLGINNVHIGELYATDIFYDNGVYKDKLSKMGVLAVEMESYALYLNAMELGKKALCIVTISDPYDYKKEKALSNEERQTALNNMIRLGLSFAE